MLCPSCAAAHQVQQSVPATGAWLLLCRAGAGRPQLGGCVGRWSPALGTLEGVLAEAAAGTSSLSTSLQFPDIVEFCEAMANAGKTVIVAALDGTFQRKVRPGPGLGWGREGEGPQWAQGSIETSAPRGAICCRRRRLGRGTQGVALGEARSGPTLLAPVLGSKGVKRTWQVAEHFPPHGSQAFGAILNLVPLAESVVKLTAVCMECFREAAYTKRLGLEKEVAPALCGPGGRDSGEGGTVAPSGPALLSSLSPRLPGRGDRRSGQVPLGVPPLLLQEVLRAACRTGQQGELPGAGEGWGGRGCPEALCPAAGPAVQPHQLRAQDLPPACCCPCTLRGLLRSLGRAGGSLPVWLAM